MVRLGEVEPRLWDDISTIVDNSAADSSAVPASASFSSFQRQHQPFNAHEVELDWRTFANERKFDREVSEKYGSYSFLILDAVNHPFVRQSIEFLETNVHFEPFSGDPLLPSTSALILLFILSRRLSRAWCIVVAAVVFNANPLLVQSKFASVTSSFTESRDFFSMPPWVRRASNMSYEVCRKRCAVHLVMPSGFQKRRSWANPNSSNPNHKTTSFPPGLLTGS